MRLESFQILKGNLPLKIFSFQLNKNISEHIKKKKK